MKDHMLASLLAAPVALALLGGVASAQTPEGGQPPPATDQTTPPNTAPATGAPKKEETAFNPRDLFVGVGVALTHNLGGPRTEAVTSVELPSGERFVQITESDDTDIRVLFETHYLLENQAVFNDRGRFKSFGEWLPAVAACGPFALVRGPDNQRRGCGPFFAVAIEPDAQVAEFGMGWFIGFGRDQDRQIAGERDSGFGVGFGVVINPDSSTIDGRVVDTETMLVRPEFRASVESGDISLTTTESTASLLIMVSKDF